MEAHNSPSAEIICAENIALLHFLHVVPVQPSARAIAQLNTNSTTAKPRRLTVKQEHQLTDVLSMLSALREDANRVTAVAVRELPRSAALEILIAVNKKSPKAGDTYLQEIKLSFDHYFNIIREATGEPSSELNPQLLEQVVVSCCERIYARLGLKGRKYGQQRPAIQANLQRLVDSISTHEGEVPTLFMQETKKLISSLKAFSQHMSTQNLCTVVKSAHAWNKMGDMSRLFKNIHGSILPPDMYTAVKRNVGKIGQYRAAAKRLSRLGRDLFVECPQITTVDLPDSVFVKGSLSSHIGTLDATLQSSIAQTLEESKIHAEIQILAHISNSKSVIAPPRVIQSNKKACYLCNAVFNTIGQPTVIKSHGKLYKTWRLPLLPSWEDLQSRLNDSLENQARVSINLMQQKSRKVGYPDPYESSALSISIDSTASIASTTISRVSDIRPAPFPDSLEQEKITNPPSSSNSDNELPSPGTGVNKNVETPPTGMSPHSNKHQNSLQSSSLVMDPGQTILAHQSQHSNIWVEFTVGSPRLESRHSLRCVTQVICADALKLRQEKIALLHNVASMKPGSEVILPRDSPYFLDFGDEIVELALNTCKCS
ncbi:hypothetical protein F5Y16DRAFT_406597 [Xylariaceae sp. FL0255]|nr:hypothetical protein F5Y16DRAFT_406597 [Xylariaceae sp. FL0255]